MCQYNERGYLYSGCNLPARKPYWLSPPSQSIKDLEQRYIVEISEGRNVIYVDGTYRHGTCVKHIIQCEAAVQNPALRNVPQAFRICAETNLVREDGNDVPTLKPVIRLTTKEGECPVCHAIEKASGGGWSWEEANNIISNQIEIIPLSHGNTSDQAQSQPEHDQQSSQLVSNKLESSNAVDKSRRSYDVQEANQTSSSFVEEETAAERRRRLAALGTSNESEQEDSEDDDSDYQNEPRTPATNTRHVRFAQSPVRGSTSNQPRATSPDPDVTLPKQSPAESTTRPERERDPELAYQFRNTIIVEDEDGEVVKKYDRPTSTPQSTQQKGSKGESSSTADSAVRRGLSRLGSLSGLGRKKSPTVIETESDDEDEPTWMERIPRISSQSRSMAKAALDSDSDDLKSDSPSPDTLPPFGMPREFLSRQRVEEDNHSPNSDRESSPIPRRRKKIWDEGFRRGEPVHQSDIYPQRRSKTEQKSSTIALGKRAVENTGDDEYEMRMMEAKQIKAEHATVEQATAEMERTYASPINDDAEQQESRDRAPQPRRLKRMNYEEEISTQEEELLLDLSLKQQLPWKELQKTFNDITGKSMKAAALPMRKRRMIKILPALTEDDGKIQTLAVEELDKNRSETIADNIRKYGQQCQDEESARRLQTLLINDGHDSASKSKSDSASYSDESSYLEASKAESGTAATTVSGPHIFEKEITQDIVPEPSYQDDYDEHAYEDAETIMTDNEDIHLPPDTKEALISSFSGGLCQNLNAVLGAQQKSVESVIKILPELLREFAIQLRKEADEEQQELATLFVRRYRGFITRSIEHNFAALRSDTGPLPLDQSEPLVSEKIAGWNIDGSEPPLTQQPIDDEFVEDDPDSLVAYSEALKFLVQSRLYKRLLSKIDTALTLTAREGTEIDRISKKIQAQLSLLCGPKDTLTIQTVIFEVEWAPVVFLRNQEYQNGAQQDLGEVIVITGTAIDAQATTCAQYMRQTWPLTGAHTLKVIQAALLSDSGDKCEYRNSDGTELRILFEDVRVVVHATGPVSYLVELGEQLAWLGAACRQSVSDKISFSLPFIEYPGDSKISFRLGFSTGRLEQDKNGLVNNGACWHALFKNPVVVKGYPTMARAPEERGLEIPLKMMAALAEATYATDFDGGILIKGFSAMFVPTVRIQNSVLWHLLYEADGGRISYFLANQYNRCSSLPGAGSVDVLLLGCSRNFLGWASSAVLRAGMGDVSYDDIDYSGLKFASAGCALKEVSISGGSYLMGGLTFQKGIKDKATWLSLVGPYRQMIQFTGNMNVILYDTEDRRAWLIDGASTLLHLTRTQLLTEPYCSTNLFKVEEFTHAVSDTSGKIGNAAKVALTDPRNMELRLDEEEETYIETRIVNGKKQEEHITKTDIWCFKDLVKQTWQSLEQIYEHQMKMLDAPVIGIRLMNRDQLEGFEFRDIVDNNFPVRPKVSCLEPSGRGWVDFARRIGAITLFGRGFGNLIEPTADANDLCKNWKHVPAGHDYLVTSILMLKDICKKQGDMKSDPLQLAQDIYWHKAHMLFEPCTCRQNIACDRVQVLLPPSLGAKTNPEPFKQLSGAVVFGRSQRWPWYWPKMGRPTETDEYEIGEENELAGTSSHTTGSESAMAPHTSRSHSSNLLTPATIMTPETPLSEVPSATAVSPTVADQSVPKTKPTVVEDKGAAIPTTRERFSTRLKSVFLRKDPKGTT